MDADRVLFYSAKPDPAAALEDARAQAQADGWTVRPIAGVREGPFGGYLVALGVNPVRRRLPRKVAR